MDKERERIINQFESVKVTRRQVLKYIGASIFAGSIVAGELAMIGFDSLKIRELDLDLDKRLPPPTDKDSLNKYRNLQEKMVDLAKNEKWGEIERILQSDEFVKLNSQRMQQELYKEARIKKRKEVLPDKLILKSENLGIAGFMGSITAMCAAGILAMRYFSVERPRFLEAKEKARKRLSFYEKLLSEKSGKEIVAFDRKLHFLAPLGGKIYPTKRNEYHGTIDPTISAEEQLDNIKDLRRNGKLGEHYIHQLTVQGRLPDQFKFAAIALILHSPFLYDWDKPFFEAEWGKIGPLIHDGGNVNTKLNPIWEKGKGRTDFIQRVSINNSSDIGNLEKMTPEELAKEPVDKLDKARRDELEEQRIDLEGKFYQRAASTLHAKIGTMPNKIPKNIRKELPSVWEKFELDIRLLLNEYDMDGVGDVTWFFDKPIYRANLSRYGKRYEAFWEPIKEELIKFEQIRHQHPEIRPKINRILRETVDSVDKIIGLN